MTKLPDFVTRGEVARLIPVVADTNKEQRATSILLAAFRGIYEFRQTMLGSLGIRVGNRSELQAWTEVSFQGDASLPKSERPDGLLILDTGRKHWKALIEAKVGNCEVGEEQLKLYLQIARQHKIDAVITISNQFVAMPTHHPVKIQKSLVKDLELYHWSWMYAVTQATLLLEQNAIASPDQRFMMEEVLRHLSHDSSGITRFDSMNKEWKDVVGKVKSGAILNKNSDEVINTVSSWHQEQRDLCLVMSRKLGQSVKLKLSRAHSTDPNLRIKDDCEILAKDKLLKCSLEIPNVAADIDVTADLAKRTITCGIRISAPQDKKSTSARVNWLARQLAKAQTDGMYVKAFRPGRADESQATLAAVLENVESLNSLSTSVVPTGFEIFYMVDLAHRFSGNKIFIDELEKAVPWFYEQVGQKLRAWVPMPPKISKRDPAEAEDQLDQTDNEKLSVAHEIIVKEGGLKNGSLTSENETIGKLDTDGDSSRFKPDESGYQPEFEKQNIDGTQRDLE